MKNKKMKKLIIGITGVALALLLIVGSNLALYSKASEAESITDSDVESEVASEGENTESAQSDVTGDEEAASSEGSQSEVTSEVTSEVEEVSYGPVLAVPYASSSDSVTVTKDNFTDYFVTRGTASWDDATGEITLTNGLNNAGTVTLKDKFDTNENFEMKGEVWLGGSERADGITIGFHQGEAGAVGANAWNMGIGGLPGGFGFKFDTWDNSAPEQMDPLVSTLTTDGSIPVELPDISYASIYSVYGYTEPFGAFVRNQDFYHKSQGRYLVTTPLAAVTYLGTTPSDRPKLLPIADIESQYVSFSAIYDGNTKIMTVTANLASGTMQWQKDVTDWIDGATSLSVLMSASTGTPIGTLQKVRFGSFEYVANADITFDTDGGVPSTTNITARVGSDVNLASYTILEPTKEGYDFLGWYDADGNKVDITSTVTMKPGGMTYTAKWDPHKYTIKFDKGNTSGTQNATGSMSDQTIDYETPTALTANGYVKEGYTFAGWKATISGTDTTFTDGQSVSNLSSVDGTEITFVAQWTLNDYTINFLPNGGSGDTDISGSTASITTPYTTAVVIPTSGYTRTGYFFAGKWTTNADGTGTAYAVGDSVSKLASSATNSESINLYAQWTAKKYTITFDGNGGGDQVEDVPNAITQDYKSAIIYPTKNPTRDGYNFVGWKADDNSTPATVTTMPLNGITFKAQWSIEDYVIDFQDQSADTSVSNMPVNIQQPYKSSINYAGINVPTRTGYTFDKWLTSDNKTTAQVSTMPLNGTTFYANWTINKYNIFFKDQTGDTSLNNMPSTINDEFNTSHNLEAHATTPTRDGYTFAGWVDGSGNGMPNTFTIPANDTTYYTSWTADAKSITFVAESDGLTGTVTNLQTPIVMSTGATIDFSTLSIITPVLPGYTFAGWVDGSGVAMPTTGTMNMPSTGLTYYTTWTPNDNNIIFDKNANDANSTQATLVKKTDETIALTGIIDPTRPGYTFEGWYTTPSGGAQMPTSLKVPAGGVTYYAKWDGDEQDIKFDPQASDATNVQDTIKAKTGTTVNLKDTVKKPQRDGYTFDGWFTAATGGSAMPDDYKVLDGGVTYYAQWTGLPQNITFDSNSTGLLGTVTNMPSTIKQVTGSTVTLGTSILTPVLPGYTFEGWFDSADNSSMPTDIKMPYLGKTYYAKWSADDQTITFKNGNGIPTTAIVTLPSPITRKTNTTVDGLIAYAGTPTYTGYTFKGWYTTATGTTTMPDSALVTSGGIVYYAQWTANAQSIVFEPNGSNVSNMPPAIPAATGQDVDLSAVQSPLRLGYQFVNWKDIGGGAMPSLLHVEDGGAVYYAQWDPNNYKVKFDPNTGTGSMADQSFVYATAQNLTSNAFGKTGYHFNGWNTQKNGLGTSYTDGESVENLTTINNTTVTLYAQWAANNYTVEFDGNGATAGTMANQTFTYDVVQELLPNSYERNNYKFDGWNSQQDGLGTSYTNKQQVSNLTGTENGTVTLYAVWKDTFSLSANDFIVKVGEVATLSDADIIAKANAQAIIKGTGLPATITVTTNNIIPQAGTYQVTFESNGEEVTVKATVQTKDNISVGNTYAIQANNIGIKSTDVANMNSNPSLYVTQAQAEAWTVDFANTSEPISTVDFSRVQAAAGTYEIFYYTKDNAFVKAYVAVTDADNSKVDNQEAIQANNIEIPLSKASSYNAQKFIDESGAQAWKADVAGKVSLGTINVNSTAVNQSAVGTYIIKYSTNTTAATTVEALVTIYDDNYSLAVNIGNNEAIEAKDFVVNKDDVSGLVESSYITNADAHGWSTEGLNSPVAVTKADFSAVQAAKGVYPVKYSTNAGTEVTAYVSVGDGDKVDGNGLLKEIIQANHFIVTKDDLANGSVNYINSAGASAWNWDKNGQTTLITNISVDTTQVVVDKGTYPVTFTTPNSSSVTVMMTVKTGDKITVDIDQNEVIQASNFQMKQYLVTDGTLDGQYCFDHAFPSAWSADGLNTTIGIDMTNIDFSQVGSVVGQSYPVTFYTNTSIATSVTINVTIIANNVTVVTFDGNGATQQAVPYTIGVEEPATTISSIPAQEPKRTGFTFVEWNTQADGLGSTFNFGSTVTSDMTVYAKWARNQYVLSFDTQGGGANPSDQTIYYDQLALQPSTDPAKTGHSFVGWYTAPSGGTYWDFDTNKMPAQNTTLYAQYTVNKYTVTFDTNNTLGGTSTFYESVPYNSPVPEPQVPVLYGYTFLGWEDASGTPWDFANNLMPDNDITLYAQWEHTVYTVTLIKYDYEVLDTYTLYAGDAIRFVTPPTVPGFTFANWVEAGQEGAWNAYSPMPDRNLTLVATYDRYVDPTPPASSSSSRTNSRSNSTNTSTPNNSNTSSNAVTPNDNSTTSSTDVTTSSPSTTSVTTSPANTTTTSQTISSSTGNEISSNSTSPIVVEEDSSWSLLALIITIVSVVLSVVLLVMGLKAGNSKVVGIIGALVGLVSIILFFIFNSLSGGMLLFNAESLAAIAMVVIQVVLCFFVNKSKGDNDSEEDYEG